MIQIQRVATYIFIFFAQIIWPFIVPFGVLMLDKKSDRKLIQKILAGVGILVSGTLAFFLIAYDMEASISGHHIAYSNNYPETIYKDRKSTRLNSSHVRISYAVFCLKKK